MLDGATETGASLLSGGATTAPAAPAATSSHLLGSRPDQDAPLAVAQDGTVTTDGEAVADLRLSASAPAWAAPTRLPRNFAGISLPLSRQAWVITDGTTLAVVSGSELVWSVSLPAGSAELNGLSPSGPPRWIVDEGIVILATPEGVTAYACDDGTPLWTISGPVDSWLASDDGIIVVSGSIISFMSFSPEDSTEEGAPASQIPTGAVAADPLGAQAPPGEVDLEALRNASLEVPEICSPAAPADADGRLTAQFTAGTATNGSGTMAATATMTHISPGVFSGRPVAVVALTCQAGGNTTLSALAVYDADHALIASYDPALTGELGPVSNLGMEAVRSVGNTVVLAVANIKVVGDGACNACEGSATATVILHWDGQALTTTKVFYELPSKVVASPDPRDVQEVYDALASSNSVIVNQSVDPGVVTAMASDPAHSVVLPEQARVNRCALPRPDAQGSAIAVVRNRLDPGDFICGIQMIDDSGAPVTPASNPDYVFMWLVVHPDELGTIHVVDYGYARG